MLRRSPDTPRAQATVHPGNAGYGDGGLVVSPEYCVVIDTLGTLSMS